MGIKCGHCGNTHTTVNQVKACGGGVVQAPTGPAMVTEKQLAFLETLLAERPVYAETLLDRQPLQRLTKAEASDLIQAVKAQPRETTQGSTDKFDLQAVLANVPAGYYAIESLTGNNDYDFIRVGLNQGRYNPDDKGKKRIQRYLGGQGVIQMERAEQRKFAAVLAEMATQEAALIGAATLFGTKLGRCGCCGKSLTDQLSRALGIGPECRSKGGF